MVDDSFSSKLKKVKSRSKVTPSGRSKVIVILAVIVSVVLISFMAYSIYQMEMAKRTERLKEIKTTAINNIRQMFSSYPDDPYLNMYITKIENSDSIEEIDKIVNDAKSYIEFRKYKDKVVDNIRNIYGKYYYESLYAQSIVNKIQHARSIDEIDRILKSSNMEKDARTYYFNSIVNSVDPDKYYAIPMFGKKILKKGKELIDYAKKLSLADIKNLTGNIVPVSFNKVAIVVPATQCGKIPFEGNKVEIYNKRNASMEPIPGVIDSSYVIMEDIIYKEEMGAGALPTDEGINVTFYAVNYSLENVPGVLYATAAGRLNYSKVIEKFGKYGEKFNNITSDTQIFDENARYLLIVSVPSTDVSRLLTIKRNEDIYVAVVE